MEEEQERRLSYEVVEETPIPFDFSEGFGDVWEVVRPSFFGMELKDLKELAKDRGLDIDEDGEEEDIQEAAAEGLEEHFYYYFNPIYNYLYPLPENFQPPEGKELINALNNTTIIEVLEDKGFQSRYYLALTGCGMDMSWEICESYINLGYYPPVHFCDLPRMAGKEITSEKNRRIVEACLKSVEAIKSRMQWKEDSLNRLFHPNNN